MAELDRRDFLKLVGTGAGAAAAAGCSDHVEKLIPYVVQPEEITPGIPVVYASTCAECPVGCGIHVRTRESRPILIEGNPEHPINRGAICARGTAGIGRTYHPGRYRKPMLRGADGVLAETSWDEATRLLAEKLRAAGSSARILGGPVGPTLSGLIDRFSEAAGLGGRVVYEPFAHEALREASKLAFGTSGLPLFDLGDADLVLDFGSDLLETGLSPVEHARQLADARDVKKHPGGGARLVYIGPRLSQTASNADEWIPARAGSEGLLALALARVALSAGATGVDPAVIDKLLVSRTVAQIAQAADVPLETLERLGRALAAARRPVALPPGVAVTGRRAVASAAAVFALNAAVGAVGRGLLPQNATPGVAAPGSFSQVLALVDAMSQGKVRLLFVHDSDPLHTLADAKFGEALGKVDFVVSTSPIANETSERAHLVLPDHTPLESWGDLAPRAGVRGLIQPTLRPLFDTQALGDTLLATARALGDTVASKLPSGSFRAVLEQAWQGSDFRAALARGGSYGAAASAAATQLAAGVASLQVQDAPLEGGGSHALLAVPSPLLYDGRGADLPWLQETPDPVTKMTWQSYAEISLATARSLGVGRGDVLRVQTPAGAVELPALPRGGLRDDVVAIAIGQGHRVGWYASRSRERGEGAARGVNVMELLPPLADEKGGRAWFSVKADLTRTGRFERLAMGQGHDNKRGRQLAEAVPLAALAPDAGHAGHDSHTGAHEGPHEIREPYDPADFTLDGSPYRWSMTIDLDRCNGCSSCVVACAVENNIPTVGEDQVIWGRVMSWLRIERYVGDGEAELGMGRDRPVSNEVLGHSDIRHSPMLCQQCGAAPCEPVCPVFATYHNPEGLNGMIYNRCIGTRYCSNNCPYKVRRFNWYDFALGNWPDPMPLMLNPDVTVRGQGVMEKCTFCVQRIELGRQAAKDQKRLVADGEIRTACQNACPTRAISFGNLKDEASQVATRVQENPARAYHALHALNTRPGITYLAKVLRGGEHA